MSIQEIKDNIDCSIQELKLAERIFYRLKELAEERAMLEKADCINGVHAYLQMGAEQYTIDLPRANFNQDLKDSLLNAWDLQIEFEKTELSRLLQREIQI